MSCDILQILTPISVFALAQDSAKKMKKWYEESDLHSH